MFFLPTNNKLMFIEGVGPNVGLVFYSKNDLSYLLCHFKNDTLLYHHKNQYFGQVCEFSENYLDIDNLESDSNISLFPNPAIDILHIENIDLTNASYSVFDTSGKIILQNKLSTGSIHINNLMSGFYFIKIEIESKPPIIRKFIKL